jgi:hypothetical protein
MHPRSSTHPPNTKDHHPLIKIPRVAKPSKLLLHRLAQHALHRRQHRRHTRKLAVEITCISGVRNLRQERRRNPLVIHIIPVDVPKKWLGHDLLRIRRPAAQPRLGLPRQQPLQYRYRVPRHVYRIQRFVREDGVVDFVLVLASERRLLQEHLIDEYTKGPPVYSTTVFLVKKDLHLVSVCMLCLEKHTSGAMNSGVPQNVVVLDPYHMSSLHRP